MSARDLPLPKVPLRHCRWCTEPISQGRPDRSWHDGRKDEPDCLYDYQLHTRREIQFAFVAERDGLHCWRCEGQPMRWRHDNCATFMGGERFTDYVDDTGMAWVRGTRFTRVEYVSALELEHTVPLWAVSHLEPAERRKYFGPWNLRLLGPCCHKIKTKAEAKQRAHVKRLADAREGAPKPAPRRKIQGAGFDKTRRRRMDGKVELK